MNNRDLKNDTYENAMSESADISQDESLTHSKSHHSGHHHSHHSAHHGGHHSHHRRKHHRSHHRHGSKKKKLLVNAKVAWTIVISLFLVLAILIVAFEIFHFQKSEFDDPKSGELQSDVLCVELINQAGLLIKDSVKQYLLTDLLNPANANIFPSSFGTEQGRLDAQVPVALKFSVKEGTAISYKIEIANNEIFSNAKVSYIESGSGIYEFKHLYANTTYFYRVTVYTNKGTDTVTGQFKTADTPRLLSIDGISNVRDIGNWKTENGQRIKQGLLIRGTELDGAVESGYLLTNEGLMDMLEIFGFKTDMDLRTETPASKDALGALVEHKYYDMVQYDGIFTDHGKEKIRTIFSDLADPNNYPIYLHCTYGCDRTGTICYLLEAMLGVSRGDCLKEYGLSNVNISSIQSIENGLKAYDGITLKEQVESYLLSCGVTSYQMDSIRNIFLEG